ncbi:MAG: CBS domain-containing protein [Thermodesulfobacteriota bacterium]
MKKIVDIMVFPVITAKEDDTLHEMAKKMLDNNVGGLPVIDDDGNLIGFLSETDFSAKQNIIPFSRNLAPQLFGRWLNEDEIEKMYKEARSIKVKDIMTKPPIYVEEDESIPDLIEKIMKYDVHRVPVVKDEKLVGIVSRRDLMKLLI